VAVALGNARHKAADDAALRAALTLRADHASSLVREHVAWALGQGVSGSGSEPVPT
jgi:epoxyqueuosine reductase